MTPRRGPTRLHAWLLLFGLLNGVAFNLALARCSPVDEEAVARGGRLPTTLHYARDFARRYSSFDSWHPMRRALAHLDREGEPPLYQALFFERRVKFQYAPTSLLLIEPFGPLPDRAFNTVSWWAVWLLVLLVAGLFGAGRRRWLAPGAPAAWSARLCDLGLALLFTLTFYPLLRGYRIGQIQTWIDVLFAGALWTWLAGRTATSGALGGLACVIKPQLGLLVVWALLRRHWRFAAGWAAVVGAFAAVSLWRYGLENHLGYLEVLSYIGRHGESYQANQSLNGLLHRAFFNGNNLVWRGSRFAPFHPVVFALSTLGGLALIALALLRRAPRGAGASTFDLAFAALCFTLAAPVVWEHHYGITLPIFALALPALLARSPTPRRDAALLALAWVLLANKLDFVHRTALSHWNFVQSYLLFGGLLLLALLYRLGRLPPRAADASGP